MSIDDTIQLPTATAIRRAHGRHAVTALTAALPIQARFFFLLVPRLVAGRCTPSRLAAYAIDLTVSGSRRLGMW
jgi:hypothetical protein